MAFCDYLYFPELIFEKIRSDKRLIKVKSEYGIFVVKLLVAYPCYTLVSKIVKRRPYGNCRAFFVPDSSAHSSQKLHRFRLGHDYPCVLAVKGFAQPEAFRLQFRYLSLHGFIFIICFLGYGAILSYILILRQISLFAFIFVFKGLFFVRAEITALQIFINSRMKKGILCFCKVPSLCFSHLSQKFFLNLNGVIP